MQKYVDQHAIFGGKKRFWGFIKESGERKLIKWRIVSTQVFRSTFWPLICFLICIWENFCSKTMLQPINRQKLPHGFSKTVSTFLKTGPQTRQISILSRKYVVYSKSQSCEETPKETAKKITYSKNRPSGAPGPASALQQKIEGGTLWGKNFRKKVSQCRKTLEGGTRWSRRV